jgi:hypothetical protein
LARRAESALLDAFAGKNLVIREAVKRKMQGLRAELCGPNPTAAERLLAERVVGCWLHVHVLETNYASQKSMTLGLAHHYQKCIDRAHRRYISALKVLSEVRKIGITVQVNLARTQRITTGPSVQ